MIEKLRKLTHLPLRTVRKLLPKRWSSDSESENTLPSVPDDTLLGDAIGKVFAPRFLPIVDPTLAKAEFLRLQEHLKQEYRRGGSFSRFRMEYGKFREQRPYLYIAPWDDEGYLFELNPTGWIVSRAEKIEANKTFMRSAVPIDHVVLYQRKDSDYETTSEKAKLGSLRLTSLLAEYNAQRADSPSTRIKQSSPEFLTFLSYFARLMPVLGIEAR